MPEQYLFIKIAYGKAEAALCPNLALAQAAMYEAIRRYVSQDFALYEGVYGTTWADILKQVADGKDYDDGRYLYIGQMRGSIHKEPTNDTPMQWYICRFPNES